MTVASCQFAPQMLHVCRITTPGAVASIIGTHSILPDALPQAGQSVLGLITRCGTGGL